MYICTYLLRPLNLKLWPISLFSNIILLYLVSLLNAATIGQFSKAKRFSIGGVRFQNLSRSSKFHRFFLFKLLFNFSFRDYPRSYAAQTPISENTQTTQEMSKYLSLNPPSNNFVYLPF